MTKVVARRVRSFRRQIQPIPIPFEDIYDFRPLMLGSDEQVAKERLAKTRRNLHGCVCGSCRLSAMWSLCVAFLGPLFMLTRMNERRIGGLEGVSRKNVSRDTLAICGL